MYFRSTLTAYALIYGVLIKYPQTNENISKILRKLE